MTLHVYEELQQGTEEWLAVRRGIVTASVVGKLLTIGAPGPLHYDCPVCFSSAGEACISLTRKATTAIKTPHNERAAVAAARAKEAPPVVSVADNDTSHALTATLVAERIAGFTEDVFVNADMFRGVESEPIARDLYARHHAPVEQVGFMRLDEDWGALGYSPDGLVGVDGLIEVKAPRAKTHILTVIAGDVPTYNYAQLQAGLLVSGRKWVDFIPYVGGLPLWKTRVHPDPAWHDAITAAVTQFEKTAADMCAAYTQATAALPITERIDFNTVELKLA
jgi:hypothetical protein